MTLGDIVEKVLAVFGVEPKRIRVLQKRVVAIEVKIMTMEDGLRDIRKEVSALEERLASLKRDLKVETSEHNQDLIMDDIERLEREFVRKRDLADVKRQNVDAACALRAKLQQLLEAARNGCDVSELEEVLDSVEAMGEDLAQVGDLLTKLDRPVASKSSRRKTGDDSKKKEDIAARRARILGESPAAPAAKPVAQPAAAAPSAPAPASPSAPAPASPAEPGVVAAR